MTDRLQRFPNQEIEKRPTECVGETIADIVGNIIGIPCDPGYSYAATLTLTGVTPNTTGTDPYAGLQAAIVYGVLPVSAQDFDATQKGELFEANFANYSPEDKALAKTFSQPGYKTLGSYLAIANHLQSYKQGVSVAMKWYESFNQPNPDGTLPQPQGNFTYHNVACYDATPKGLQIKPWLGPTFGQGGYAYLPITLFDQIHQGSWGFNPDAWRWLSLVQIGLTHPRALRDILPLLKSTV